MILQSLNHYYDILMDSPDMEVAPPGYSKMPISFALNISDSGDLLDLISLIHSEQRGKKYFDVPRRMVVPEQVKKSVNISPNFLYENSVYVLGIGGKNEDFSTKRFEAFRQFHLKLLGKVNCDPARAVIKFLENYDPRNAWSFPGINNNKEALLKGGNLVFMFNGRFVHDDPTIRQVWEMYKTGIKREIGQCLVTGEMAPIARLHPSLKGIKDANPTGASLVGFNAPAYESYNRAKGQGLNSPVSEKAAFAYTTALNHLLSPENPNRKIYIGDTTVVYWAESQNPGYASVFGALFDPQFFEQESDPGSQKNTQANKGMIDVATKVSRVQKMDITSLLKDLEGENPKFFVLGLAPNAARVAIRFFLQDPFLKFIDRINQHYRDLEIIKEFPNQPDYISIRMILQETVSKKSKDQPPSPLLSGSLIRAILTGQPYPASLYTSIITRIRVDTDSKEVRKVGYIRAALVKACLIRKYKNQPKNPIWEVLTMSLNEQSTYPAYLLGRLFAVLEKVQKEAIGDANATIKDRYFTSACATPASVFPILLRLSQHHIAKADYGKASDNRIEAILNKLEMDKNPIPAHLTLDEQGVFILGYYHQRAAFYSQKNETINN